MLLALALVFALTSNDIISYITKMISMLMSGLFICSILGRFWLRFNWQGALAALVSGMVMSIVVLMNADWLAYWGNPCIPSVLGSPGRWRTGDVGNASKSGQPGRSFGYYHQ